MPKLSKWSKIVNTQPRKVKEVSIHRFSGSENLYLASEFKFDEKETLGCIMSVGQYAESVKMV